MPKARHRIFLEKSVEAMVAAIEVHNKPDFKYREETFAILAVNSWELLLKAKVLQNNKNKIQSIYKYETKQLRSGVASKRKYVVKNRARNPQTIGFWKAYSLSEVSDPLPDEQIKKNLELLFELRNNAVHFVNRGFQFEKLIYEISAASVANYAALSKRWFGNVLDSYQIHLLPIGFLNQSNICDVQNLSTSEANVVSLIGATVSKELSGGSDFFVMLDVDVRMKKKGTNNPIDLSSSQPGTGTKIELSEEDLKGKYPMDYDALTKLLRKRYSDFKINKKYHDLRRPLSEDQRFAHERLLDPDKPDGIKRMFFSQGIVDRFDSHYKRV